MKSSTKSEARTKLIYPFNDFLFRLPDFRISHWVPVIFPPCRNSYFFSTDVKHSFNDHTRIELLKEFKHSIVSLYDTCGYNPLLFVVEAFSVHKSQQAIDSLRDQGEDVRPKFLSVSSPESVWKRFGIDLHPGNGQSLKAISEGQEKLLHEVKSNPMFLDILEYIVYNGWQKYEGNMFEEDKPVPKNKHLEAKKKVEGDVVKIIQEMQGMTTNELFAAVSEFHGYQIDGIAQKENQFRSAASDFAKFEEFISFIPIVIPPVLAMIFLRFPLEQKQVERNRYIHDNLTKYENVVDIYELFGSRHEYVIKVWAKTIAHLEKFINDKLYAHNINTVTKIVFRIWKKEGWRSTAESRFPPAAKVKLQKLDHRILSVMSNYCPELARRDKEKQIDYIKKILIHHDISLKVDQRQIEQGFQILKDEVIEKHSIKLECREWIKTLVFIKASRGQKTQLTKTINEILLGVSEISFARKFYHTTGEFDFIVPIDCPGLSKLKAIIEKFVKEAKEMTSALRIYFDIPEDYVGGIEEDLELTPQQHACITALLPNSERLHETSTDSPRYAFYKHICKKRGASHREQIRFEDIHKYMTPTIEVRSKSIAHTFIRFRILDKDQFNLKLGRFELKKEQINMGITLTTYRPLHDANVAFCILTTSDFESLLEFIKELDKYCSSTLPNLIFSQSCFEPDIPGELRCKPCIKKSEIRCKACNQYPHPRLRTNIHTMDLRQKYIDDCKLAVVQICPKSAQSQEDRRYVTEKLREAINNNSNIIIFPELSVPSCFVEEMKKVMKQEYNKDRVKKPLFVVAGSQITQKNGHKYELCHLLFLDQKGRVNVYDDNYRNFKTHRDDPPDLSYGNNGVWRYVNTGYGNFVILNCFDFLANDSAIVHSLRKKENRCDILMIVANNPATQLYDDVSKKEVKHVNQIIVIANAAGDKHGRSRFYGPYKDPMAEKLVAQEIPQKKEDTIYHEMNAVELDKSRAIGMELLIPKEEATLKEKYFTYLASQEIFGPIHRDKW
jgi:predicted amidohydrolase/DNA-binding Lrp family transcriptional regulator